MINDFSNFRIFFMVAAYFTRKALNHCCKIVSILLTVLLRLSNFVVFLTELAIFLPEMLGYAPSYQMQMGLLLKTFNLSLGELIITQQLLGRGVLVGISVRRLLVFCQIT